MHRDLIQGRRLELEAMNGAVVRLGLEYEIPQPELRRAGGSGTLRRGRASVEEQR
jgi:ketopantoate reductase